MKRGRSRNLVRRGKEKLRGPRLEKWIERGMKKRGKGIWENCFRNLPRMREEFRLASKEYPLMGRSESYRGQIPGNRYQSGITWSYDGKAHDGLEGKDECEISEMI